MDEAPLAAVAPIVETVPVGVFMANLWEYISEVFNNDAGASVRQGSPMWLAKASDAVEVALPGKGRLTASVVASVRQSV